MLSQTITAGSTLIRATTARYLGVSIEPPSAGSNIVTIHSIAKGAGTAGATMANKIDQHVKFTATDNWVHLLSDDGEDGIHCIDGLVAVMTNAGTAQIFFA